ncbi:hypothetical protein L6452_36525 [Arctium lappa]|uniref:Uncharacterized protein n=1 Tax=Arctium lappa TaxID=4217 RepID=A0ACB8YAC0_ARCLA|nr:hypothetical protein L6452_36525 [Arctium lappa]
MEEVVGCWEGGYRQRWWLTEHNLGVFSLLHEQTNKLLSFKFLIRFIPSKLHDLEEIPGLKDVLEPYGEDLENGVLKGATPF